MEIKWSKSTFRKSKKKGTKAFPLKEILISALLLAVAVFSRNCREQTRTRVNSIRNPEPARWPTGDQRYAEKPVTRDSTTYYQPCDFQPGPSEEKSTAPEKPVRLPPVMSAS